MDNRYHTYGCPELMQDGRFLTNFTPKRTFEQMIRKVNNIESSADYRMFLQRNGETIMNRETEYFVKNNTCDVNGQCVKF
jgi:hypothetical protein